MLLHGVFKLAKRRKLIEANPSEDAERITLDDPGIFNILEPVEFEAVYRAVLGRAGRAAGRRARRRTRSTSSTRTSASCSVRCCRRRSTPAHAWASCATFRGATSIRLGDDPSGVRLHAGRRGRRRRASALGRRRWCDPVSAPGGTEHARPVHGRARLRVLQRARRAAGRRAHPQVFYAALVRAGLGHRRDESTARQPADADPRPRPPALVVHVGGQRVAITKVQAYAGHRDIKTTKRYVHHRRRRRTPTWAARTSTRRSRRPRIASPEVSLPDIGASTA